MKREDGILAETIGGTEMRLHRFRRPGGDVMRRIPWHQDMRSGEWYSGIEGPEIKVDVLREFLK